MNYIFCCFISLHRVQDFCNWKHNMFIMTSTKEREQLTATWKSADCDRTTLNCSDATAAYVSSPADHWSTAEIWRDGRTDARTTTAMKEEHVRICVCPPEEEPARRCSRLGSLMLYRLCWFCPCFPLQSPSSSDGDVTHTHPALVCRRYLSVISTNAVWE